MISLNWFFDIVGILLFVIGGIIISDKAHPKRWLAGGFWILYGIVFVAGDHMPEIAVGVVVVVMALIAGFGGVVGRKPKVRSDEARHQSAVTLGNKLFIPALAIPVVTVIGTLLAPHSFGLIEAKSATMVSFGIGCIISLIIACVMTRDSVGQSVQEARRLTDALSWAVVLPQMLGMLGFVFNDAGVGKAVAHLTTAYIDMDYRFVAVAVYCIGMALFTIIMGNGFAAFPVMTGGVGVPILVGVFHGNPAPMVAIGMMSGYCGTLLTPMAANYNIVPAALLELPDKYGVIRAQAATAFPLLIVNIVLLNILMF
ncbi:permease [Robbsia andropogonis]|uniref:Permease n=1 Tax=Robbsia andropogonis TaxID=28092 RepID=A0A0F5JY83_9BURK|nr:DUF979 domain-containing protein [Robbsia andropogonis]KKB62574.1 permease [Robbsia andropogonis]MCP1118479.1 DUF979 domain-containing protein [Robbsia andropogonis]MCP1127741.1 DUF979 domain-containing protein [Robbsia andropogonis]